MKHAAHARNSPTASAIPTSATCGVESSDNSYAAPDLSADVDGMPTASGPLPATSSSRDFSGKRSGACEIFSEPPRIEGYQFVGPIGHGRMGVVWRAVQLGTRREVALKILQPGLFGSTSTRRWFEREIELTEGPTLGPPGGVVAEARPLPRC